MKRLKSSPGFTLIELMVVLVIISLFTSTVMINVSSSNSKDVENEATRLYQILKFAQDEAIMQGIELGLVFTDTSYSFSRLQDSRWLPLKSDKQLGLYDFGSDIQMQWRIEDENVISELEEEAFVMPVVMLLSSGEITAFEVEVSAISSDAESRYKVIALANGSLELEKSIAYE